MKITLDYDELCTAVEEFVARRSGVQPDLSEIPPDWEVDNDGNPNTVTVEVAVE